VCNFGKANSTLEKLGWQLLEPDAVASKWDGLTDGTSSWACGR